MNQRGNTTILGVMFLFLICLAGLKIVSYKLSNFHDQRMNQALHLCTKKLNGITKTYISNMKRTNHVIMILTLTQRGTALIPGGVIVAEAAIKSTKLLVQKSQVAFYLSYLNKSRKVLSKKCIFNPVILSSPYKMNFSMSFSRDILGRAKVRRYNWNYNVINSHGVIRNKINLNDIDTKISSKKHKVPSTGNLF
jgi:hypothetical protein